MDVVLLCFLDQRPPIADGNPKQKNECDAMTFLQLCLAHVSMMNSSRPLTHAVVLYSRARACWYPLSIIRLTSTLRRVDACIRPISSASTSRSLPCVPSGAFATRAATISHTGLSAVLGMSSSAMTSTDSPVSTDGRYVDPCRAAGAAPASSAVEPPEP